MTPKLAPLTRAPIGLRPLAAAAAVLAAAVIALGLAPARASAAHLPPPYFVGLDSFNPPKAWQIAKVRGARVQTMRVHLSWGSVEHRHPSGNCNSGSTSCRHHLDWSRYDQVFLNAARRGVRLVPMFLGVPRWVSENQRRPPLSANSRRFFFNFVQQATKRYGPNGYFWSGKGVSTASRPLYWQIWNEPNTDVFWRGAPNAAEYASFLSGGSDAANRGDSAVRILTAGLTYPAPGRGIDARTFLRGMVRANPGIGRKFSAVGLHPYALDPYRVILGTRAMRLEMNSLRKYHPIFITEIGWSSASPNGRLQVGTTKQASYFKELYGRLLGTGSYSSARSRYNVMGAVWFNLQDINDPNLTWSKTTGLLRTNGSAKPSWYSLLRVTGVR